MERKFLLGLGLEKELVDQVIDQHQTDMTALRTTIKTQETEIDTLRGDLITANSRVSALEQVDVDTLQTELANEKAARVKDRQEFCLNATLQAAGCKDIDYLKFKLGDSVEFLEDGSIKDSEAFLTKTKETYEALFQETVPPVPNTGGRTPGVQTEITREEILKKPYSERAALFEKDPQAFSELMKG